MKRCIATGQCAAAALASLVCGVAFAALPAPTPAQQQAQASQAQQAAAAADKAKQELAATMEQVTARWRARAAQNGWAVNAPAPAVTPTDPKTSGVPVTPGNMAGNAPVRSEKRGTAPSSPDVKDPSKKGL